MTEAEIKTISGATIFVKGTTTEVNEILSFWQRRENFFKHRRQIENAEYPSYLNYHHIKPFFGKEEASFSPKETIIELINKDFFNEYRTLTNIREKILKEKKVTISNGTLHPTLMLLVGRGFLQRERQENGRWGYKIKDGEKKK